jgi:hypothetical protein
MTAGQRAMATAMLYPEAERLKRKGGSFVTKEQVGSAALSKARTVLRDQALAERVLAGTLSLDDGLLGAPKNARLNALLRSRLPSSANLPPWLGRAEP